MILLFGFNTSRRDELPVEVRVAATGTDALKVISELDAKFPRIARQNFPILRTVKHYRPPAAIAADESPPSKKVSRK